MLKEIARASIRAYQFIFSEDRFFYRKKSCNFYPSCSEYAKDAIYKHGLWRGGRLSTRRILRCNPSSRFSVDIVPE